MWEPYVHGSDTSYQAYLNVGARRLPLRVRVLLDVLERGPATDEEIQQRLSLAGSTQRPRRVELVRGQLLRDSGKRRPTSRGELAVVWEPTITREMFDLL